MPDYRRQPSFAAVTIVIFTVSFLGLLGRQLKPYVQPLSRNALRHDDADFLAAGAQEPVKWRTLDDDPFEEALRKGKPVLVYAGGAASRATRDSDREVFTDRDIVDRLNSSFIPVRVDVFQQPAWQSSYLWLSVGLEPNDPQFQFLLFDTEGNFVTTISRSLPDTIFTPKWLAKQLDIAELAIVQSKKKSDEPTMQERNVQSLLAEQQEPDTTAAINAYRTNVENGSGGYVQQFNQIFQPSYYRLFLDSGHLDLLDHSLDTLLKSPMVDWVNGGIFQKCNSRTFERVETDKISLPNAEMADILAQYSVRYSNPNHAKLARFVWDYLHDHVEVEGYLRAYRIGDAMQNWRSRSSSFAPRVLAEHFSDAERDWLRTNFALDVSSNPQMLVASRVVDTMFTEESQDYLDRLRKVHLVESLFANRVYVDSAAICVARMVEAALALHDTERLAKAALLVDRILAWQRDFVEGEHELSTPALHLGYLRDSLAMADLLRMDYLAYGRKESLTRGISYLLQAFETYKTDTSGWFIESNWLGASKPPKEFRPTIATDFLGESSVALALRLASSYGNAAELLGMTSEPQKLKEIAKQIRMRFGRGANEVKQNMSAYFDAAIRSRVPGYFLVFGVDCVQKCAEIRAKTGICDAFPAFGGADTIFNGTKEGIYIVTEGKLSGPVTLEVAVNRFRP